MMHASNPEGADMLREIVDKGFRCDWLPVGPMSFFLGQLPARAWLGWPTLP